MYINNIAKKKDLFQKPFFFFSRGEVLCTYPVIPSFLHVCIHFEWFPLWLFLELDSRYWNIALEVSSPFYNLITRNDATNFRLIFWKFLCYYKEKSSLQLAFTS